MEDVTQTDSSNQAVCCLEVLSASRPGKSLLDQSDSLSVRLSS